ncbi:hypothetical protein L1887_03055 [Cichorium endivia]|nr:hypothetical protein L1887_03055 [Cichorium endivia]
MGEKAVLIRCNYAGTKGELRGCINDMKRMYRCLVDLYGFSEDDIKVLIDADDSYTQPTGRNIRQVLADSSDRRSLVSSSSSITVATALASPPRLVTMTKPDLMNDDFRDLVDQMPHGCRITIISDSSHSGGLIDEAK